MKKDNSDFWDFINNNIDYIFMWAIITILVLSITVFETLRLLINHGIIK